MQLLYRISENDSEDLMLFDAADTSRHLPPSTSNFRRIDNAVVLINSILLAFVNAGSITGSMIGALVVGSSTEQVDHHQASGVDYLPRIVNASSTHHNIQSNATAIGVIGCLVADNSSRCGTTNG